MDEDMKSGCVISLVCLAVAVFAIFTIGRASGFEAGYTAALDDARLGKPAKYKLVQTAEKWVEVEK